MHRKGNRIRDRGYALKEMDSLSLTEFKKMFRMTPFAFENLLNLIEEKFTTCNIKQAECSSGSSIQIKTKLAVTIRWLAGGSYIDICFAFGVSPGSFYSILWETMTVIDSTFVIGFPFDDEIELKQLADGFSRYSYGLLDGCVLAIDGWVCKTRQPFNNETDNPRSYRNRKGCFGIVILGGCDANLKFRMWSCIASGSCNDVTIWEMCAMKAMLDNGKLPYNYYFIGDEAFPNTTQFLVPYSGNGLDTWSDSFNYHLSRMRQCIERAFGVLVQRWGIFGRNLKCSFNNWPLVCTVTAKLHNYLIDMDEGLSTDIESQYEQDIRSGDNQSVILNDNVYDETEREGRYRLPRPTGNTRNNLRSKIENAGARRPIFN